MALTPYIVAPKSGGSYAGQVAACWMPAVPGPFLYGGNRWVFGYTTLGTVDAFFSPLTDPTPVNWTIADGAGTKPVITGGGPKGGVSGYQTAPGDRYVYFAYIGGVVSGSPPTAAIWLNSFDMSAGKWATPIQGGPQASTNNGRNAPLGFAVDAGGRQIVVYMATPLSVAGGIFWSQFTGSFSAPVRVDTEASAALTVLNAVCLDRTGQLAILRYEDGVIGAGNPHATWYSALSPGGSLSTPEVAYDPGPLAIAPLQLNLGSQLASGALCLPFTREIGPSFGQTISFGVFLGSPAANPTFTVSEAELVDYSLIGQQATDYPEICRFAEYPDGSLRLYYPSSLGTSPAAVMVYRTLAAGMWSGSTVIWDGGVTTPVPPATPQSLTGFRFPLVSTAAIAFGMPNSSVSVPAGATPLYFLGLPAPAPTLDVALVFCGVIRYLVVDTEKGAVRK